MREFATWNNCPRGPPVCLPESKSSTVFNMNGVRFHFDAMEGQKTGAFLDQRENYAAASQICTQAKHSTSSAIREVSRFISRRSVHG